MELVLASITKEYLRGRSMSSIGKEFRMSTDGIRATLLEHGTRLRKRGKLPAEVLYHDIIDDVVSLYVGGCSSTDIAAKFNLNYTTILKLIRSRGIRVKQSSEYKELDDKDRESVLQAYQETKEVRLSSERTGISESVIRKLIKEEGIYVRIPNNWKYRKTNGDYFNELDSFDKLYFLGLIFADGHNNESSNSLAIVLQSDDRYIQEKMALCIRGEIGHLRYVKKAKPHHKDRFGISFRHPNLSRRLAELGCVHDKTYKLKFPKYLSDTQFASFLLGLFDGDGHIGVYFTCRGRPACMSVIDIVGTEHLIRGISTKLENILGIRPKVRKHVGCYSLRFSNRGDILRFYDFIYKDALFAMVRKHDKFIELFKHKKIPHTNWWIQNGMTANLADTSFSLT